MARKRSRHPAAFEAGPPRKARREDLHRQTARGRPGPASPRAGSLKSRTEGTGTATGPAAKRAGPAPRSTTRVKSLSAAANLTASVAPGVLRAILDSGKRLEPALAEALEPYRDVRRNDRRLVMR